MLDFRCSDCFPHFIFIAILNLHSTFPAPFPESKEQCWEGTSVLLMFLLSGQEGQPRSSPDFTPGAAEWNFSVWLGPCPCSHSCPAGPGAAATCPLLSSAPTPVKWHRSLVPKGSYIPNSEAPGVQLSPGSQHRVASSPAWPSTRTGKGQHRF